MDTAASWINIINELSEEEQNDVVLFKFIEASNFAVQYCHRYPSGLYRIGIKMDIDISQEDAEKINKYYLNCVSTMIINHKNGVITFSPKTSKVLQDVRDLYVKGFKEYKESYKYEYFSASKAITIVGQDRIQTIKEFVRENIEELSPYVDLTEKYMKKCY